jgi:hypothetical protein
MTSDGGQVPIAIAGATLAERLARAPLSPPEAVAIALDVAKAIEQSQQNAAGPCGLGFPECASPEQLRGEPIDRTSDSWTFGCILFQLLAGKRPFTAKSAADLTRDVLNRDPDWSLLPDATPLPLRLLIARCLKKDPRQRLQFIGDARLELEQLSSEPLAAHQGNAGSRPATLAWAVVGVLAAAVGAVSIPAARYVRTPRAAPAVVRFEEPTADSLAPQIAVSPDGRRLAYRTMPSEGVSGGIRVRALDSPQSHVLPGTESAGSFSWSPDGQSIAFAAADGLSTKPTLKRVDLASGAVQALSECDDDLATLPAWNREGVILFSGERGVLRRVSARGGEAADVTALDSAAGEIGHRWPSLLPDQQHFLYQARMQHGDSSHQTIYIGSLDGRSKVRLMDSASMAVYAEPGFILFVAGQTLMARPFDAKRLAFTGVAATLVDDVMLDASTGGAGFAVSDTGTLVYRRAASQPRTADGAAPQAEPHSLVVLLNWPSTLER